MRVLHVTDTHLGARWGLRGAPPGLRAADHARALELALAPALREEVDLVVHSGDLFDRSEPDAYAVEAARRLIREAARRAPVLVVPGNHDRRGLAHSVGGLAGVQVADEPRRVAVRGLELALIPFQRTAEAFAAAARSLAADVLIAHQAFDGQCVPAGRGAFRFRAGAQADTIGPAHLPERARVVWSGHLHPRQTVLVGEATVVCPGSTERTAFAEAEQTKGYGLYSIGAAFAHAFVDLPARPMVHVGCEADLERVTAGALVYTTWRWEAAARARGGYCRVRDEQLALFDSPRR